MALWVSNDPLSPPHTRRFWSLAPPLGQSKRTNRVPPLSSTKISSSKAPPRPAAPMAATRSRSEAHASRGGAIFAEMGSTARCAGVYDEDCIFSPVAWIRRLSPLRTRNSFRKFFSPSGEITSLAREGRAASEAWSVPSIEKEVRRKAS